MGMYFNSDQTVKMVQRVNRHFATRTEGGKIAYWRKNADFFAPGKKLYDTAAKNGVVVDPSEDDDDNSHNGNWMNWLEALHNYPDPKGGYLGDTLCRYIYEALTDQSACREIVFAVVPDALYITLDEPIKIPAGKRYSLLLTIHTVEVDKVSTAIRRAVALRKKEKEKAKNKKKI